MLSRLFGSTTSAPYPMTALDPNRKFDLASSGARTVISPTAEAVRRKTGSSGYYGPA